MVKLLLLPVTMSYFSSIHVSLYPNSCPWCSFSMFFLTRCWHTYKKSKLPTDLRSNKEILQESNQKNLLLLLTHQNVRCFNKWICICHLNLVMVIFFSIIVCLSRLLWDFSFPSVNNYLQNLFLQSLRNSPDSQQENNFKLPFIFSKVEGFGKRKTISNSVKQARAISQFIS